MSTNAPLTVPSVPSSGEDLPSIAKAVDALKANVEVLTGAHALFHVSKTKTALQIAIDTAAARANPS
jgi:hypothetical protein